MYPSWICPRSKLPVHASARSRPSQAKLARAQPTWKEADTKWILTRRLLLTRQSPPPCVSAGRCVRVRACRDPSAFSRVLLCMHVADRSVLADSTRALLQPMTRLPLLHSPFHVPCPSKPDRLPRLLVLCLCWLASAAGNTRQRAGRPGLAEFIRVSRSNTSCQRAGRPGKSAFFHFPHTSSRLLSCASARCHREQKTRP